MKNLVLIGFGNIATKHIEVFRALGHTIIASCNRSEQGNQDAQLIGGIPNTYTDYHEMIAYHKPDGIIVCVSFDKVYEVVNSLLEYRIPLLIEKPTGTSLAEHLNLVKKADYYGTPTQIGLNRRHYSIINKALEACGGISKISSIVVEWSENVPHLMKKLNDDQILLSNFRNTIHGLDLINYLGGGLDQLKIASSNFGMPHLYASHIQAKGKANKSIVSFYSTWETPIPWKLMWIAGGKRYQFMPMETCIVFDDSLKTQSVIEPDSFDKQFKPGFYQQALLFIDLMDGVENNLSLNDISTSMALCEMASENLVEAKTSSL